MLGRLSPGWVRWCCRAAQLHLCAPSCALPAAALCQAPSPRVAQGGDTGGGLSLQQSLLAHRPHPMQPNVLPSPCKCCTVPESESCLLGRGGGRKKKKKTIKKFKD